MGAVALAVTVGVLAIAVPNRNPGPSPSAPPSAVATDSPSGTPTSSPTTPTPTGTATPTNPQNSQATLIGHYSFADSAVPDPNVWYYGYPPQDNLSVNTNWGNRNIVVYADNGQTHPAFDTPASQVFERTSNGMIFYCKPMAEPVTISDGQTSRVMAYDGAAVTSREEITVGPQGVSVVVKGVNLSNVAGVMGTLPAIWLRSDLDRPGGGREIDLMEIVAPEPGTLYQNFHNYNDPNQSQEHTWSVPSGFWDEDHDFGVHIAPNGVVTLYVDGIQTAQYQTDLGPDDSFRLIMNVAMNERGTPWTGGPEEPVTVSMRVGSVDVYQGNPF